MSKVHIREHLLQLIWEKQYIHRDRLATTDHRSVRVLEPGRVSLETGPDILRSRISIAGTIYSGDIEIHRKAPEWYTHGHGRDPRYNSVILHVLLRAPRIGFTTRTLQGRMVPMLVLEDVLIQDIDDVRKDAILDGMDLRAGHIPCAGQNSDVPATVLISLLERLALERIEIKLRRFEERIHELIRATEGAVREQEHRWDTSGENPNDIPPPYDEIPHMELFRRNIWEQALYEGFMEGLGYARNRQPFMKLCRIVTLQRIRDLRADSVQTESLLFGVAGLFPSDMDKADAESRLHVHALRQEWHRLRTRVGWETLSAHEWITSPGRPANSPYVRLIAARDLIRKFVEEGLFLHLLQIVKRGGGDMRPQLLSALAVRPGPFWERRVSFSRVVPGTVQPLGGARADDLIVNALVPLLLLYARMFHDVRVRTMIVALLRAYPPLQENAVTRRIDTHLLRKKVGITTALHHQGAMQLFNYYCGAGRCGECDIGRIVWG